MNIYPTNKGVCFFFGFWALLNYIMVDIKTLTQLKETVRSISKNNKVRTFAIAGILGATSYFLAKDTIKNFNYLSASALGSISASDTCLGSLPVISPTIKYGFALDTFDVSEDNLKPGESFSSVLNKDYLVPSEEINSLFVKAKKDYKVDLSNIIAGKKYTILSKEFGTPAQYCVFQPDKYRYLLFKFGENAGIEEVKWDTKIITKEASGVINNSLWQAMTDNGLSYELADKMEDALKFQLDFHHFRPGDKFKLVYDDEEINGQSSSIKALKGAYFKKADESKEYYAFWYDKAGIKGFFDQNGKPMKTGFLKSPLKFTHISSGFNMRRLHPILGYVRPHCGTDYAAPAGTPILAVADAVVSEARNGGGNGNYVKLKHNAQYATQYLHMSRFAPGIRPGVHVKMGQTIGFVGSTGLATGPHVCFRFWKNGTQVNHLREKLPTLDVMNKHELATYKANISNIIERMRTTPFRTRKDQVTSVNP
jgi:murein DD-endopeptidase MepM/ murein hydrolase activator NlpD